MEIMARIPTTPPRSGAITIVTRRIYRIPCSSDDDLGL
jgi:hypothetical protein